MVSNASDDFPEPERPVKTIRRSRGSSRSTFLRLCSRAPRMVITSATAPVYRGGRPSERMFGSGLRRLGRPIALPESSRAIESRLLPAAAGVEVRVTREAVVLVRPLHLQRGLRGTALPEELVVLEPHVEPIRRPVARVHGKDPEGMPVELEPPVGQLVEACALGHAGGKHLKEPCNRVITEPDHGELRMREAIGQTDRVSPRRHSA